MKERILVNFGGQHGLKQCFVAGGAITSLYTNKPINDWDLYPKSLQAREDTIRWLFESGYWCSFASSRALTFVRNSRDIMDAQPEQVQVMIFDTFETADKIFDLFDFTVCMGAFDFDTEKFVLHEKFLLHCSQRFIQFNPNTRFPYASAWRIRKYEERGYTIGKMEYFKILLACQNMPITSWDELRDQIGGVYGESMDIPEDEPYSLERAFEVIASMKPGKSSEGFSSVEEAIACTSGREIPYYYDEDRIGNKYFAKLFDDDDEWYNIGSKPLNGKLVGVKDVFPDLIFYKKVLVDEAVGYRSMYKSTFIYKLGEEVSSGDPYIYSYPTVTAAKNHYHYAGSGKQCAVLTLQAESEADVVFDIKHPRLKKCKVISAEIIS